MSVYKNLPVMPAVSYITWTFCSGIFILALWLGLISPSFAKITVPEHVQIIVNNDCHDEAKFNLYHRLYTPPSRERAFPNEEETNNHPIERKSQGSRILIKVNDIHTQELKFAVGGVWCGTHCTTSRHTRESFEYKSANDITNHLLYCIRITPSKPGCTYVLTEGGQC